MPGEECTSTGSACVCDACGNFELDASEECDDGNLIDGDGCSPECLCNPETTPDVCNLTGDGIVTDGLGAHTPVTITEDAQGNSTFSAEGEPPLFSRESTRDDSCGTGTISVSLIGTCPVRTMVADSCDAATVVIEGCGLPLDLTVGTLERVVSSPSRAFLDLASSVID